MLASTWEWERKKEKINTKSLKDKGERKKMKWIKYVRKRGFGGKQIKKVKRVQNGSSFNKIKKESHFCNLMIILAYLPK